MAELIPIFPLSLVVFPGEKLNLHIFEQRYKDLINDSITNAQGFGIPTYMNDKVQSFGTYVELSEVSRIYDKGEMDVSTKGSRVFRIEELHTTYGSKAYAGADIQWIEQDDNGDDDIKAELIALVTELDQLLKINKPIPPVDEFTTHAVAHYVGFDVSQEYQLLELSTELDRQLMMKQHLERVVPVARQTELLKQRVKLNGHFKDLVPPRF